MGGYEALLELQERDTRIDQLRHRRETLPERSELATAHEARDAAGAELVRNAEARDELLAVQRRREDEVAIVEAKTVEVNGTMYGGSITSPKELKALQDELEMLGRRQRGLEDQVLDLMERLEPIAAAIEQGDADLAEREKAIEAIAGRLTAQEAEIDVEIDSLAGLRSQTAEGLSGELLSDYEDLRTRLGGIGVARLVAGLCGGCNLALSAVEVDRLKSLSVDERVHCEECGRLLVR